MKKLFKDKKGFTLMEMLIVVAIIVILVAVSIPVFTSQLNKAKEATDQANVRSAKAAAVTLYLTNEGTISFNKTKTVGSETIKYAEYFYDATNGILDTVKPSAAYGQGTTVVTGVANEPKGRILQVNIMEDGTVDMSWVSASSGS